MSAVRRPSREIRERRERERRSVRRTLFFTTLVFFLLVGALFAAIRLAPQRQLSRLQKAMDAGDTALVRTLAEELEDRETARVYLQRCDYLDADALQAAGDLDGALAAFLRLGSYEDAPERANQCRYAQAEAAAARGEFESAEALFKAISGYADSAVRAMDMRYARAEALAAAGEPKESFLLFAALGDHRDARERALALAVELCGEPDLDKAAAVAQNLTTAEAEHRLGLREFRDSLPRDIIDVGFFHTVGLRADGSVLACGSNEFGQCDVADWTDITAVACGAYHTVGLRADGTVVAAGRSSEHQCDVSGWTGVTQIAAADWATFARLSDGTVVCCGYVDYYMLPDWGSVERIFGGSYDLGALRDGDALISHMSARSEELTGLVDLALNTGFAVGLREDGTVVSPKAELPDWEHVAALSVSGVGVLALTDEGRVLSHFFRSGDRVDTDALRDVRAMAAGGSHFAFVHADGSVTVLGETDRGQGDTAEWKLF